MARFVLKTPVFLKALQATDGDFERAKKKFKGQQTCEAVGAFLANADVPDARFYMQMLVESDTLPSWHRESMFRCYRIQRSLQKRGRVQRKNVQAVDLTGVVREQALEIDSD